MRLAQQQLLCPQSSVPEVRRCCTAWPNLHGRVVRSGELCATTLALTYGGRGVRRQSVARCFAEFDAWHARGFLDQTSRCRPRRRCLCVLARCLGGRRTCKIVCSTPLAAPSLNTRPLIHGRSLHSALVPLALVFCDASVSRVSVSHAHAFVEASFPSRCPLYSAHARGEGGHQICHAMLRVIAPPFDVSRVIP